MSAPTMIHRMRWPLIVAAVIVAFIAGGRLRGPGGPPASNPVDAGTDAHDHGGAAETEVWTCSMHPQIRLPVPGSCPICGMDLVPAVSGSEAGGGERELVLSEAARKMISVRTVAVERRPAVVEVRMVGKVDYDETRIGDITSYVSGRLERMFVDYTGVPVKRGDHMVDIYSPELIAAQEELLRAIEAARTLERSRLEVMRRTARMTVTAAREKLRLWGLLPEQIESIESSGKVEDRLTLYSSMSGVVIEKHANQGMYVDTGTRIYTVADLTHLWVRLEAYESDMAWVHLGQEVEFTADAYPGTTFKGRVSFVAPIVDARTRTVKLRVNVANDDLRLKPEMLVRAVVKAQIAGAGRVFDPYLAGKWIGPMHPEIVKPGPGDCDICGMPLVPAESLGFVGESADETAPLVIPATAPLITGRRAVVYVEKPDADRPTYEGREVRLGPRAGDYYIVQSGLEEGERVVVEGNFKIDSALQIQAKPSMMNPVETPPPPVRDLPNAWPSPAALNPLYRAYLDLQGALSEDDSVRARAGFERVAVEARDLESGEVPAVVAEAWGAAVPSLRAAAEAGGTSGDLDSMRTAFRDLSLRIVPLARQVGHALPHDLVVAFCPMAFDSGAEWLQATDAIANPYYGAMMFGCGEVTDRVRPHEASDR